MTKKNTREKKMTNWHEIQLKIVTLKKFNIFYV